MVLSTNKGVKQGASESHTLTGKGCCRILRYDVALGERSVLIEEPCAEHIQTRHIMTGAWPDYDRIAQFQLKARQVELEIKRVGMEIDGLTAGT